MRPTRLLVYPSYPKRKNVKTVSKKNYGEIIFAKICGFVID